MRTLLVSEIVNMSSILPPLHLPDHSVLISTFQTSYFQYNRHDNFSQNQPNQSDVNILPPRKNIKKISNSFFMSEQIKQQILITINKLENIEKNQAHLDKLCDAEKDYISFKAYNANQKRIKSQFLNLF